MDFLVESSLASSFRNASSAALVKASDTSAVPSETATFTRMVLVMKFMVIPFRLSCSHIRAC